MKKLLLFAMVGLLGLAVRGNAAVFAVEAEVEEEAVETVTIRGIVEAGKGDALTLRLRVNKTDTINIVLDDNSRPLLKEMGKLAVVTGIKTELGIVVQKFEVPQAPKTNVPGGANMPNAAPQGANQRNVRMNVTIETE